MSATDLTVDTGRASRWPAIPGLIDAHVHLFDFPNVRSDDGLQRFVADAVPLRLSAFLAHGVTTSKSCGDPLDASLAVRDWSKQDCHVRKRCARRPSARPNTPAEPA